MSQSSTSRQQGSGENQSTGLELEGVVKRFGQFTAVDEVSVSFEPGNIYGLIGPNGAGKTTLLNLITGALEPTEGTIRFHGSQINSWEPYERAQVGIIRKYQVTNIYEQETVMENMRLAVRSKTPSPFKLLRTVDSSDIDPDIHDLLSTAGLDSIADTRAENLSHGQKQWLEIMMTVATQPELLLLDEPTSGLSSGETQKSVELIQKLRRDHPNMTILVIEHNIEFIKNISEQLLVLHRGKLIAEGSATEIEQDERVQDVYLKKE